MSEFDKNVRNSQGNVNYILFIFAKLWLVLSGLITAAADDLSADDVFFIFVRTRQSARSEW